MSTFSRAIERTRKLLCVFAWARSALSVTFVLACSAAIAQDVVNAPHVSVGDYWTYQVQFNGTVRSERHSILRADNEIHVHTGGQRVTVYKGAWTMIAVRRKADNSVIFTLTPGHKSIPFPLGVGDKSSQVTTIRNEESRESTRRRSTWTVLGWEDVTVPAGTFRTVRLERREVDVIAGGESNETFATIWYSPDTRRFVQTHDVSADGAVRWVRLESYRVSASK